MPTKGAGKAKFPWLWRQYFLETAEQVKSSQVRNCTPGNMEKASSRGHEASPKLGLSVRGQAAHKHFSHISDTARCEGQRKRGAIKEVSDAWPLMVRWGPLTGRP